MQLIAITSKKHANQGHEGWMVPYVDYLLCLVSVLTVTALAAVSSAAAKQSESQPSSSQPRARVVAAPVAGKQPGKAIPGAILDSVIDLRVTKDGLRLNGCSISETDLPSAVAGKLVVIDAAEAVDARNLLRIIGLVDSRARSTFTNPGQVAADNLQ